MNRGMKATGKRSAGKPHAAFDEAGAGNVVEGAGLRPKAKAMEPPPDPIEPARQFPPIDEQGSRTEDRNESDGSPDRGIMESCMRTPGTGSGRVSPAPGRSRSSPGPPSYDARHANCPAFARNVPRSDMPAFESSRKLMCQLDCRLEVQPWCCVAETFEQSLSILARIESAVATRAKGIVRAL